MFGIMDIKKPFREHHLLTLIEGYDQQKLPLDVYISNYFSDNKALGSKDRAFIAETAYGMIRWKLLLDYLITDPATWEKRLDLFLNLTPSDYLKRDDIPPHIRVSFPQSLFDLFVKNYGEQVAMELCLINNEPAPLTVRVNPLKIDRNTLLARWKFHEVTPCKQAPFGINFSKRINFFTLPEFKEGLFEVQDEGSQLLSELVEAKPGQQVLDFCGGSGGKTLAYAYKMQGKGQIYIHDVRSAALLEAKKRLRRAGIQNSQTILSEDPKLKRLKKQMDWVLVDAPCTGTGTIRRNPDMKWKFDEAMLQRLIGQQRTIFEQALSYLKADGHIIYATCSILREENSQQVEHFIKTYNLELAGEPFASLPQHGGMDGFFGAILKKKKEEKINI
jgi:16S rRNA (cytosine967-C5)-methyltransferase